MIAKGQRQVWCADVSLKVLVRLPRTHRLEEVIRRQLRHSDPLCPHRQEYSTCGIKLSQGREDQI